MIIGVFSDAPSQEVHLCLVDRSHGLDCDRHKQKDWLSIAYLLVFLSAAVSAAAPGVWDVEGKYDDASVSITVTGRLHGPIVGPTGRSDPGYVRLSVRPVGQTVGQTVAEPPT